MSREPQQPSLPWKTRIAVSMVSVLTDSIRRSNGTVNRRFLSLLENKVPPSSMNGVKSSDITVDASRSLWFRLFIPENLSAPKAPVIVFFHGGGFVFLGADSRSYDAVCRRFAFNFQAVVVSVNYRLAPEHKFPCQYEDGLDVLRFLDAGNGDLPVIADLGRCFLSGDSAGANLCHHVVVRASRFGKLEKVRLAGVVSIQPFFGGEERTESEIRLHNTPIVSMKRADWMWKAVLPEGANRNHEAAEVCSGDLDAINYPPTMVIVGGFDPLQDWQRRFYRWLKKNGKDAVMVEYPNAFHAFYLFPELREASLLDSQFRKFIMDHP